MTTIQKFLKFILPKSLFQKIEEESKNWFIECEKCGFSKSYWESGGIRAYTFRGGKAKWVFGYCPNCKNYKLFKATKKNKT